MMVILKVTEPVAMN